MAQETTTARPETVEQIHAQFLRAAFAGQGAGLRRLADDFDRLANQVGTTSTYSQLADTAVHTLMWGLANLSLERAIREAAAADVARAKGE